MKVASFRDLMQYGDCQVACLYSGEIVRTLTIREDACHILAGNGEELEVSLDLPIRYEAWCFDRGNMIFEHQGTTLKICGEGDLLLAASGNYHIQPAE